MHLTLIFSIVGTLLLSSTAFFLFPNIAEEGWDAKVLLAWSIAINVSQFGAVWFLLTSLHTFRGKLKFAYYILAMGIFVYALAFLSTILSAFGIMLGQIVQAMLSALPYILSSILILIGIHRFARVLKIHDTWSSLWFIIVCSLGLSFLVSFAPHSPIEGVDETTFDTIIGMLTWGASLIAGATILAVRIRRRLSKHYQPPMLLLIIALGMLSFAGFHEVAIESNDFVSIYMPGYFTYSLWPILLASFMLLAAGINFKAVSKELGVLAKDASYLDVVSYTAQLASNPTDIDITLDKVRVLTANKKTELTSDDLTTLLTVYRDLETYLTTKDPVLKMTKETLRMRLPEAFQRDLIAYEKGKGKVEQEDPAESKNPAISK